jgi:hypothetical protein
MYYIQSVAVVILVHSKLMREEYLAKHAKVIQRCWRQRKQRAFLTQPLIKLQRAVIIIQSHYRRRKATVQVNYFRYLVGTRLKRFVDKPAVKCPDAKGRMTCVRDILPNDDLEKLPPPLRLMKLVNIPSMSNAQREELGSAVAKIQAMAKFQFKVKRIEDIQRVWRGYLARRELKKRRKAAAKIQNIWRSRLARKEFLRLVRGLVVLQAHMRSLSTREERRQIQEAEVVAARAAVADLGEEVVDGRRIRSGGSVVY